MLIYFNKSAIVLRYNGVCLLWVRYGAAVPLSSHQSHHSSDSHTEEQPVWRSSRTRQRPAAPEGQPCMSHLLSLIHLKTCHKMCSCCVCSPVSVCKWCKGNVLLLVDSRLLGRFHQPDNRSSCEFSGNDTTEPL